MDLLANSETLPLTSLDVYWSYLQQLAGNQMGSAGENKGAWGTERRRGREAPPPLLTASTPRLSIKLLLSQLCLDCGSTMLTSSSHHFPLTVGLRCTQVILRPSQSLLRCCPQKGCLVGKPTSLQMVTVRPLHISEGASF